MKIVVFGTGGVGGYFGGRLAQAGNDVTFIARGQHLNAIKQNGLTVKSINGDFNVKAHATEDLSTVDTPDLIILGVKSWQISDAAQQLKKIVAETTMVLPLQNGANNADKLRAVLPDNNVIVGLSKIISRIESPGVIDHFAVDPEIVFAEYNNQLTERIKRLNTVLNQAKIKNSISEDIHLDIWKKYLFITTISGIGALTRASVGAMRENTEVREIMLQTANEIVAVANAKGIGLQPAHVDFIMTFVDNLNYNATTSMQRDIMEGRPSELEDFNGYVVEQGTLLNVDTATNSFIYHSLKLQEQKARESY